MKTTITLPEDTVAVLRELAGARNVSFAEVVNATFGRTVIRLGSPILN